MDNRRKLLSERRQRNHVFCSVRLKSIPDIPLKQIFKLFFLTNVISNYCEDWNIKLLVYVCIKISTNLGSNFLNLPKHFFESKVATFWIFGIFLVISKHFSEKLSIISRAQSREAWSLYIQCAVVLFLIWIELMSKTPAFSIQYSVI